MPSQAVLRWFASFAPHPIAVSWRERLRASLGALLGIAAMGASVHWLLGPEAVVPYLIAPMGASAVLLFGVPASPLAQPWSFIGGNLVAATLGVISAMWIGNPIVASAVALAAAIGVMFALRCIHPPSGAVALTAVLGGPAIHALGLRFVIEPVALQSAVLLGSAIVYHAVTGHRYPHVSRAAAQTPPGIAGVTRADLEAIVRERGELLAVAADDLESVVHEAQLLAYARSFSELTCEAIMSRDAVSVSSDTTAAAAWRLLERHRIKALPVVDAARRVVGIVTRTDFVGRTAFGLRGPRNKRRSLWRSADETHRVDDLMTPNVRTVDPHLPVAKLIPVFAHYGHHHIPVVDHSRRLIGMITQSDLIGGLHRQTQTQARELKTA
ncbi:MAG: HPP family protein [Trinickia sp.]|uniref:HPP family protein n=1 Tax=Trinickia sp. TaxID=2571163 RepID=UPI003F7D0D11